MSRFPKKSRHLALEPLEHRTLLSATVATDQQDYPPGGVVLISGSGFQPGETVQFQVVHNDGTPNTGGGHTPWLVVDGGANDLDGRVDGNIKTTWYVNPDDSLGSSFLLTANGLSSGETASTTFTDSRTINSATLNGGSSVTVAPGATITAAVNATTSGFGSNSRWYSVGWRVSTTAPGTVTVVNTPNHDSAGTYTETFSITAPSTPGTYNVYFIAYSDDAGTSGASSTYTLSSAVTVQTPNTAPTLVSTSATVPAINEDDTANTGTSVSTFVAGLTITDPDSGALKGIAVTGADNAHGTWQYSTNSGGAWSAFGTPSDSTARLLADSSSNRIRFVPNANFNSQATFTFRAWDQTSGTNGNTGNAGSNGGTTAFSATPGTATIIVAAVNDTPSFTKGADQTVLEDSGPQSVAGWATGMSAGPADEAGQTLTFQVTGNTNTALFAAGPAIDASGKLTYTPAGNANGSATITLVLKDNGGGADTSASQSFTINITAVNDTPSFTKGADQTVLEDAGPQSVAGWATGISAGAANEAGQTLAFQVTGNTNPALFAAGPAIDASGNLTYTPADNANGSATITLVLKDNGGGQDTSAPQSFTINVTPVNDAPSFTKGADQTVLEDAGAQTVTGWATDISAGPADEAGQTVAFQVTGNTNPALFAAGPAIDASGKLTYTPADNANGSATITVVLQDNGGEQDTSTPQSFTINVTPVNDVPSFTAGADQTVLEDAGPQTVTGWATDISAGPANEAGQTLTFQVTGNTNPALFAAGPAIDASGNLTYTPADNANGSAIIAVVLQDDGGGQDATAPQSFTINVTPVNDAPSFTKGADQTVLEDAGAQTVTGWATDISAGPADEAGQSLAFQVTGNTNPGLFAAVPVIDASGNLTYTPADNANGSAIITVVLQDDGGEQDTSTPQSFTINVTAVNDLPSFTAGADQTVLEDAGPQTVSGWATDISAGPANEAGQTLTFQVTGNTNPALFAAGPAIDASGNLTYTPADNANGSAIITVVLQDDGGGQDTSAPQSFTINVKAVNDAPTFSKGADQTVLEDAGPQSVAGWATGMTAGPADEAGQSLAFQVTGNTNPGLFAAVPVIDASGNLTYTPADNANGSAIITVVLQDDGGGQDTSAPQSFTINVTPVNDLPSFTKGAEPVVLEDCGPQTFVGWATDMSPGPADEASQTVTIQIVAIVNSDLFAVLPAFDSTGTLTFTPADNANGLAIVYLHARDDGGEDNGGQDVGMLMGFGIWITAVNDPPSFTAGADQTVLEDAGPQAISGWATGISAGPADEAGQTVAFQVAGNTNPGLFSAAPAIDASGKLTYTPADNANGSATITLVLKDNGGGADTSAPQSFMINVTPVNDAPSFTKGADQTVLEDAGPQAVSGWATGISAGPADEAGQTLTFQVTGDTNPGLFATAPVIDASGKLTYTPADNANGSATITLVLKDNGGGEDTSAPQSFTINVTSVNNPPSFTQGADQTVLEDAGPQSVTGWATGVSAGPADEAGQTLTFQVTGNTNPTLFAAGPAIDASGKLTYTPADNANGSATITVVLQDDGGGADTSAPQSFTINVTPVNDAPSFTKGADQTVLEDAGPQSVTGWATGISAGPADEAGQTLTFQVTGDTNPGLFATAPVIDASGKLTYTPADNANGSATITLVLKDNGGGEDTSAPQSFTINVTSVNNPPSFTRGADQTVLEDAGPQSVTGWATGVSAGPANEAGQTLTFQVTGNTNPGLFATAPVIDASGKLTYTPADNANGSATITVVLQDDGGGADTSAPQSFMINVTPVNDAPSFTKGADQTVLEDAGPQAVSGWATGISAGPADEAGQTLTFQVTGDTNPGLFATAPVIDASGKLTYTPADNANGSATITVVLQDDGGGADTSAPQSFTINVTPVNDAPSFTKGADQTVLEDAGPQSVTGWATGISAGPADEAGQTLTFQVTGNTNPGLFAAAPAIDASGKLTYTPADNANGSATITVVLQDDGGGADTSAPQSFTINVTPVNDAPSFTKGADQTVLEDAGPQAVSGWATGISAGPADEAGQTLTFQVTGNTNPGLFAAAPAIDASGKLTYTPADNANGSATITVVLQDDGGGADTSAPQSFTINVTPVNDAPSFTKGADQTVLEDAGPQSVTGWATGISAGPANEAGQTLTFQVTGNTNTALFAAGPAIDASGKLTYTPANNANGSATITLVLKDNGGGQDTSASQSFTINVTAVNDPPSFIKGADQTVLEDAGPQSVTGWATGISAGPADEAGQTLTIQVTGNTNPGLFAAAPAIDASGKLTYTPANNANGSATITLVLKDNGGGQDTSAPQSFMINVTPVNDVPSFTKGADQTVLEDAGPQSVTGWATGISAGPANEAGQTLTFQVTGNTNPALFATGPAIDASGKLTYTPANNANGSATITLVLKDNGGGQDTSAPQSFMINVTPVNDVPSFTKGADQTVLEDAGPQSVTGWATGISAGPANEAGQTLTFQVTGNTNPALFATGPAIDASGKLTYTPANNANGSATITVVLKDNGGGQDTSAPQSFMINVTPVNDAPSFTKGANQTVLEDAGPQSVTAWATGISAGPANEAGQTLTFQVAGNTNPGLFAAAPLIDASGKLTYTPADNANGSATITVVLKDNGGGQDTSAPQSFTINVTPVNDAPSFTKGADQTVLEDAGPQSVTAWATGISAGPANETGQTLTFQVTGNTNPGLFAAGLAIDASGKLTYTPANNANGSATITVVLKDNGGGQDTSAPQSFTINVTPVNDAPSFTKGADQTVLEDAGPQSVTAWATGISAGPADEAGQALTFQVLGNTNPTLFATAPTINASGKLTYTPAANANGWAVIAVALKDDGGIAGGGQNTSAVQGFVISVLPVNDAPSFVKGADQLVSEDCGPRTVPGWASSISAGPANESGQGLNFQVVGNTNPALFSALSFGSGGTLAFTPAANANGTAVITVQLKDNGGTAWGGVDCSACQTFTITVTPVYDDFEILAVGADAGKTTRPVVKVFDAGTKQLLTSFMPYDAKFHGGVRVAVGDVNNDGAAEVITAPGPGMSAAVKVYDLKGHELTNFRINPYDAKYQGGLQVAVGDVNGDGWNDIIAAPSQGISEVRVFQNLRPATSTTRAFSDTPTRKFAAFPSNFIGGVSIAAADLDGDGKAEAIVGSGPTMRATIRVFDLDTMPAVYSPNPVQQLFPFAANFRGGVQVSTGRVDADATPDIIAAAGTGGNSAVQIFNGANGALLGSPSVTAYSDASRNAPIRVVAKGLGPTGQIIDLFAAHGSDGRSRTIRTAKPSGNFVDWLLVNDADFAGGMFIA